MRRGMIGVALATLFFSVVQVQADSDEYLNFTAPFQMKASAYCCGEYTATEKPVREGFCAGKPEWIGQTAVVYEDVDGKIGPMIGIYEIEDTGGNLIQSGERLDIYNPNYDWCIQFGVQTVWVQLTEAEG